MLARFTLMSACRSLLVGSAFALWTLATPAQSPTSSSVPCSTGTAAFFGQSYSGQTTIGSPFAIQVNASVTGNGCNITFVRLYADNKSVQGYSTNGGGSNFPQVTLSDGFHNLVGVAWDQDGYSFRTQDFNLFVANEDRTVYIPYPANGAVLTNPDVHFDVRAREDTIPGYYGTDLTHIRVYVDNQDVYDKNVNQDVNQTYVDFYKTFPPGGHSVVAIAWNYRGQYIKSYSTFTVK